METAKSVDVLVVGAGPVGLTAALLLHARGLSVEIVERREGPQRAPAAHVVNARTFEIWRQTGIDVDRLRALAQDPDVAGSVQWVTKLGGRSLGSLPFEQQGDDCLAFTPTPLRNLSQHRLEPLLRDELGARGIDVRYALGWSSAEYHEDHVVSTLGNSQVIRSDWLLACDGAGSPVRRSLGIEPIGPARLASFLMIHLRADLRSKLPYPGVLFWICDATTGGTFVSHGDDEWVFMHPIDTDHGDDSEYSDDQCQTLVAAALEDPDTPIEILATASWTMTAQIAQHYRSNRAFLVGDSAHRYPPTGGLGLNSGVADAHNLVWKLAAVQTGADIELLESYETERRPVAQRCADISLANAMKLIEVPVALAQDGDVAAAIAAQATHFDMLGMQLGYRYGAPDAGISDDAIRTYTPSADVGARLPHAWITRAGRRCSTLDLIPYDRAVTIGGPESRDADFVVGRDFDDLDDWWTRCVALPANGRLRVRPDQHVEQRWA